MTMAKYHRGPRVSIDYTPASSYSAGDVIVLGNLAVIADCDNPLSTTGLSVGQGTLYAFGGEYVMTANGAMSVGKYVHWNPSTSKINLSPSAGTVPFGWLVAGPTLLSSDAGPATDGDACLVLHDPIGSSAGGRGIPQANTAISTVGAGTLTAAAIIGGVITRSGSVAAYTDTSDTAALIYAGLTNPVVGSSFEVTIKNTVAFAETIVGGTGVTVSGLSVIPPLSWGTFLVTITSATAVSILGIAQGPLCTMPPTKFTTSAAASPLTSAAGDLTGANHVVWTNTTNGAFALTTRTAAQMFSDIPNAQVGMSFLLTIVSQGDNTITITAGANVTITGTATIATKVTRTYVCTFTTSSALTMQSVSKGTIE